MNVIHRRGEKRAIAFFDGQNLFHHAKKAFGYHYPNYDPKKLFNVICEKYRWRNKGVRFYTGIPTEEKDPAEYAFWRNRLSAMDQDGVVTRPKALIYQRETITSRNGNSYKKEVAREKGIDVELSLDVYELCCSAYTDVVVIFSQDQDFTSLAERIHKIGKRAKRLIEVYSAFPYNPKNTSEKGIDKTAWIKIDKNTYDACIDTRDYRPFQSWLKTTPKRPTKNYMKGMEQPATAEIF